MRIERRALDAGRDVFFIFIADNELESEVLDQMGALDRRFNATCELRLSDGYGEYYLSVKEVPAPRDLEDLFERLERMAIDMKSEDKVAILEACLTISNLSTLHEQPIAMLLYCPACGLQHVDKPQPEKGWTNPPHRSHECQGCGHTWRPCDRATVGVQAIATTGSRDGSPAPLKENEVRVDALDLATVTTYFGERNWPDTAVGNAAQRLHSKLMAIARRTP